MQHKEEKGVWVWCSGCTRKSNPDVAVCDWCYLKYDGPVPRKQEEGRKKK